MDINDFSKKHTALDRLMKHYLYQVSSKGAHYINNYYHLAAIIDCTSYFYKEQV